MTAFHGDFSKIVNQPPILKRGRTITLMMYPPAKRIRSKSPLAGFSEGAQLEETYQASLAGPFSPSEIHASLGVLAVFEKAPPRCTGIPFRLASLRQSLV
jgi:hypothetical protein